MSAAEVISTVQAALAPDAVFAAIAAWWHLLQVTLIVVAVIIMASSIDDLFIDLLYWRRTLWRAVSWPWTRHPPQSRIDALPQKLIAVMVPAWRESEVIASMVANTQNAFDYGRYAIFVGVYANDPDTAREVARVAERFGNVHRAEVPHDGPTSKADCLNWIVQNILLHEERTGERFDVFLLHDAEDVVHPYGLKTVNAFIETADMIQMPVLSMDRPLHRLVAGHYMDEFAEFHSKDLPVRSDETGMTPSAGVATAFSRAAMLALCEGRQSQPFNTDSLTEDYDVAHRLSALGFRSRFVAYRARVARYRRAWFRKGQVAVRRRELVATREFFPDRWSTSVRQKARWMLGISYMGWRQLGWFGDLANRYFLFRDRKALLTAPTGALAYLIVLQVLGWWGLSLLWPRLNELPPLIEHRWVWIIIWINFVFLVNRVLHRIWFTTLNHGPVQGLIAPFRIVVSNLISFGAFWRSMRQFLWHLISRRPITWDKTQHSYPSLQELRHRGGRIGDILLYWRHVSPEALDTALASQTLSGRPIGLELLDRGAVEELHLAEAFAEQGGGFAGGFDPLAVDEAVSALIQPSEARRFGLVPEGRTNGTLTVVAAEPVDTASRQALERILSRRGITTLVIRFAPLSRVALGVRLHGDAALRAQVANLGRPDGLSAYVRLGDGLVRRGLIGHRTLVQALARQAREATALGDILVTHHGVSRSDIDAVLAEQARVLGLGADQKLNPVLTVT